MSEAQSPLTPLISLTPKHLFIVVLFAYNTITMQADTLVRGVLEETDDLALTGMDDQNHAAHPLLESWAGHQVSVTQVGDPMVLQAAAAINCLPPPVESFLPSSFMSFAPTEDVKTFTQTDRQIDTNGGLEVAYQAEKTDFSRFNK